MNADEDYTRHWDEKFRNRPWGRYPPEDLVRFMGRNFRNARKDRIRVLEVGCGPGANLWFLHREGFAVAGIDASSAAVELALDRLRRENAGLGGPEPDLRTGNFAVLPWPDASFDVVVDIFSLYANTADVIQRSLAEIARVLKPGGLFYSKVWGTGTTGFGSGTRLEQGTYDRIPEGPCRDMGVTHFFEREEIDRIYGRFLRPVAVDVLVRTDEAAGQRIEEFHCQFRKAT